MRLDMLDTRGIKATCFFLGWAAEHYPHIESEALRRGHKSASHGYAHRLIYEMSPEEFLADVRPAKDLVEEIVGQAVLEINASTAHR